MNSSKQKIFPDHFLVFIRIFLGLVFLFSSLVKGVDPVGTAYRVEDYLLVYGWTSLVPYALWITFVVIISEFLIGVSFLFRLFIRTAARGMFLMLVIFLVVTWLDARYNMVSDCGCFGDAVKLTNWQTFYKNVVLLLLNLIFLWKMKKKGVEKKDVARQMLFLVLFGGMFAWFMFYNLNHLPVIDFRNWKTGRNMTASVQKPQTYVTYQNKKTGEEKEFLFPDYPWKDTAWMARWTFVAQRTVVPEIAQKYDLVIEDSLGNDRTRALVENPGFRFFLVSYNLSLADKNGLRKAASISRILQKKNISMVLLTASGRKLAAQTERHFGLNAVVYQADETDLKAMVRSNPGLLLLHNGVIIKKWHYHDFPDAGQLKNILASQEP